MSKIIITGSTGFLGQEVIRQFHRANKNVLAFVVKGENTDFLDENKTSYVFGDITNKASLDRVIQEGDVIVHLAAIVSISKKDDDRVWKVNYEGTKNVLTSAIHNHARQLVYVSSVHAIPFHSGIITEEDINSESEIMFGAYEKSKRAATKLVLEHSSKELKTAVVFPSGILGPGDEKMGEMSTLIQRIAQNKLPAYVSGGYAFCDVRDVASVISEVVSSDLNGTYLVSSGFLSLKEIVDLTRARVLARRKPIKIPRAMAWSLLPFFSLLQRVSKKKPLFTSYSLRVTKVHPVFSTSKAEQLLHRSLISPQQALLDEIDYLKDKNLLAKNKAKKRKIIPIESA